MDCSTSTGHTLPNLLMSLGIGAILLGIGIPSMAHLISANHLTSHINKLVGTLAYARSEAVYKNEQVIVCKSADQRGCTRDNNWSQGWLMFIDANGNRSLDNNEQIIISQGSAPKGIDLKYRGFGSHHYVIFRPNGSTSTNGTFIFCNAHDTGNVKAVIINRVGRVRLSVKRPDGKNLPCMPAT